MDHLARALEAHDCNPTYRGDHIEALCPHHDDRTPSLSISQGADGRALVCCQAGCLTEDVVADLGMRMQDLFSKTATGSSRPRIAATYRYEDADGRLLYEVVRNEPKGFRQRRPDGRGGWSWNVRGVERVPFRLPAVLGAIKSGEVIYVVEGEKDVETMVRAGFTATTNAQGAGSWPSEWGPRYFTGAQVVVIADNDEPGRQHARKVASSLSGHAREVRVVELPDVPEHGDVSDYLVSHSVDDLREVVRAAPVWRHQGADKAAGVEEPGDDDLNQPESEPRRSQATQLVELANRDYRFGQSEDGSSFAVLRGGPNVALSLRGRSGLRTALAASYFAEHGKVPSASALTDALSVIEGTANETEREVVALRVAVHHGGLVLDLGDSSGRAVVVEPGCWKIVERSPVLFRRSELTKALPVPVSGGKVEELAELVNIAEDTFRVVVGALVGALFAEVSHPILALLGLQGTGKTTAATMISTIIDPSAAPTRAPARNDTDWAVGASGSWVLVVDNISSVPGWLSDAWCRAVTGDGLVRRALYSDGDISVLALRRVLILTSIDPGALAGDLGERIIPVELVRIDGTSRRTEAELWATFQTHHPRILGGLLDIAAEVLDVLPTVTLAALPRMADFGRILAALDKVTGWDTVSTYRLLGTEVAHDVVEADPVATAVAGLVPNVGDSWAGMVGQLYRELTPERPSKDWPGNPRGLSGRLRRSAVALRATGVVVEIGSHRNKGTPVSITRESVGEEPSLPSPSSLPATHQDEWGPEPVTIGVTVDVGDSRPSPRPSPVDTTSYQGVIASGDGRDGSDDRDRQLSSDRTAPEDRCQRLPAEPIPRRRRETAARLPGEPPTDEQVSDWVAGLRPGPGAAR